MALFEGVLRLPLRTSRPPGQRLHSSLKLSLSELDNGRPLVGYGGEGLIVEGREDFKPEDPVMSDLISSK